MSNTSLLPYNATAQERALDLATSRVGDVPVLVREMWNPDTCPAGLLAFMAWAFSVDEWDDNWSDEAKRATIREAVLVQSRKGSVWSVRKALANAGYGSATLLEGAGRTYNATVNHNGLVNYGGSENWAKYRAVLSRPIANKQVPQVRRILETTAPARCQLIEFVYTEASNIHDAAITYDGAYNHGTA